MLEYWYRALRSPVGVCLRITHGDFESVRQRLYRERKEAMDPELDSLSIVQSPSDPLELWIVKKDPSSDTPPKS